jgi:Holliday junction DNA helicase RuvA
VISRLRGQLLTRSTDGLVEVETAGGVVYEAEVPLTVLQRMPAPGSPVDLRTHQAVSADSIRLFGFLDDSERALFRLLMTVDKVGPKLALQALSAYSAQRLARALAEKDIAALTQVSGIGRKTAERLALELSDKVSEYALRVVGDAPGTGAAHAQEAVAALVALGIAFADADDAVRRALEDGIPESAEELIRRALQRR